MGGYGATVTAGASLTQKAAATVPCGLMDRYVIGNPARDSLFDPRVKTVITFGAYGMNTVFDAESIKTIRVPMLMFAGSEDDVVGYEKNIRPLWRGATSVDRDLLTFENANHNAGAPMPAPAEDLRFDKALNMYVANHYIDAVWDNTRMNNISEHFITAWLNKYLKSDPAMDAYFDLVTEAQDGVWAANPDGTFKAEHTYWKGFPARSGKGLRFEKLKAGE